MAIQIAKQFGGTEAAETLTDTYKKNPAENNGKDVIFQLKIINYIETERNRDKTI